MIAGLLLRNFKTYYGVNFIPFRIQDEEHLNIFIGNNGTGKSSILEALNAYFNKEAKWIPHTGEKDVYVAPLFLLNKAKYSSKFTADTLKMVEQLSDFFWTTGNIGNSQSFIDFRESLKAQYMGDNYLLLLGLSHTEKEKKFKNLFFAPFDKKIKTEVFGYEWDDTSDELRYKKEQARINKIMQEINDMVTFIYIPAETNIADFLRLESSGMQDLVNRKIKEAIEGILESPYDTGKKENILDFLNDKLLLYIKDVEDTMQNIDKTYKFSTGKGIKLSSKDLVGPIISAFYEKRTLQRGKKPIDDLSSGERKKALIDIIYSFLCQKDGGMEKEIIFAIDEPESSLDTGNRYDTFERIEKISNLHNHQVFITTHWYGLLPIIQEGIIHCLELPTAEEEQKPQMKRYDAKSFISERKNDPDDNYFKSFSDLSASIVSSLRAKEINWIIVEGLEDKNYLEYYLTNIIPGFSEKFRVLPVGGCGNVKLLYEHLFIPIENSKAASIKGHTLCLVDTDASVLLTSFPKKTQHDKLTIMKLQYASDKVILVYLNNPLAQETRIEDCLEPRKFYDALEVVVTKIGDEKVRNAFANFKFDEEAKCSRVKGDDSILAYKGTDVNIYKKDKEIISNFVEETRVKVQLSIEYTRIPFKDENSPPWIKNELLKQFPPYNKIVVTYSNTTKKVDEITPIAEEKPVAKDGGLVLDGGSKQGGDVAAQP